MDPPPGAYPSAAGAWDLDTCRGCAGRLHAPLLLLRALHPRSCLSRRHCALSSTMAASGCEWAQALSAPCAVGMNLTRRAWAQAALNTLCRELPPMLLRDSLAGVSGERERGRAAMCALVCASRQSRQVSVAMLRDRRCSAPLLRMLAHGSPQEAREVALTLQAPMPTLGVQ